MPFMNLDPTKTHAMKITIKSPPFWGNIFLLCPTTKQADLSRLLDRFSWSKSWAPPKKNTKNRPTADRLQAFLTPRKTVKGIWCIWSQWKSMFHFLMSWIFPPPPCQQRSSPPGWRKLGVIPTTKTPNSLHTVVLVGDPGRRSKWWAQKWCFCWVKVYTSSTLVPFMRNRVNITSKVGAKNLPVKKSRGPVHSTFLVVKKIPVKPIYLKGHGL